MKGVIEEYGLLIVEFIAGLAVAAVIYLTWDKLGILAQYIANQIC